MDAREFRSTSSPGPSRPALAAAFILALLIAWALWRGYAALLPGDHAY